RPPGRLLFESRLPPTPTSGFLVSTPLGSIPAFRSRVWLVVRQTPGLPEMPPPVTVVEIGNGNADAAGSMHEAVVADINADMPVATAGPEKHQIAGIQVIERNGTAPLGLGARGTRQRQVADT